MGESAGRDAPCLLPPPSFLPTHPLSCLQCLGAVGRVHFLTPLPPATPPHSHPSSAFPPSESSLQEIKGFKRRSRVSYGALWLSGIAGSDWKAKLDFTGQTPETKHSHFVWAKLSLWWGRMQAIGRMLERSSWKWNWLLMATFCHAVN